MSPRRLDPAVIGDRLREIRLLLDDLKTVGDVDADVLRRHRPTRHIVERVLSQIVELAGSINTHVVTSVLGRAPDSSPPGRWRVPTVPEQSGVTARVRSEAGTRK